MKKITHHLILLGALIAGVGYAADQGPAYFTVSNAGDNSAPSQQFTIKVTDPGVIQQARTALSNPASEGMHVSGVVVKAPAYFNAPWSFHLDPASISFFEVSTEVCDSSTTEVESHLSEVGGAFLPGNTWCPWSSKLMAEVQAPSGAATAIRVASAASSSEAAISPGALISIYGQNLTTQTEQAGPGAWPTTLAGVSVQVQGKTESTGHTLPLLFASPTQVNAIIPADVPGGLVTVNLKGVSQFQVSTYLEAMAPGLFVISQNGRDYAAATVLLVRADGTRSTETLASLDPASGMLAPAALDFGSPGDQLYLSLYGTGFDKANAATVLLTIGSEGATVLFAGPQGQVAGLDQLNIAIPQSLGTQPFFDLQPSVTNADGYPVKTNSVRILVGASGGAGK